MLHEQHRGFLYWYKSDGQGFTCTRCSAQHNSTLPDTPDYCDSCGLGAPEHITWLESKLGRAESERDEQQRLKDQAQTVAMQRGGRIAELESRLQALETESRTLRNAGVELLNRAEAAESRLNEQSKLIAEARELLHLSVTDHDVGLTEDVGEAYLKRAHAWLASFFIVERPAQNCGHTRHQNAMTNGTDLIVVCADCGANLSVVERLG
jgi:hypothetical protein